MSSRYRFKVVLVGNEAVGKTSLILRFVNQTFAENYIPTLGVNFMTKDIELEGEGEIRLVIWDIGGQATWKAKLPLYLKGTDGAIVIFDLTRTATFVSLEDWISKVQAIAGANTPFIVVGNKCDLQDLLKVKDKEVKKFLKKQNYSTFFQSSAKTGVNVEEFFKSIALEVLKYRAK